MSYRKFTLDEAKHKFQLVTHERTHFFFSYTIRFGIWLMPDNQKSGTLEDFIRPFVPKDDKLFPYIKNCLKQIPPEIRKTKESWPLKAKLSAWLACQENPAQPYGLAIACGDLIPTTDAQPFTTWLKELYQFSEKEYTL